MIITKDSLIEANKDYLGQFVPRNDGQSDDAFRETAKIDHISLTPASGKGSVVTVTFKSNLVWTVATSSGVVPVVGSILSGLFDTDLASAAETAAGGGSVRGLVINGKTILDKVESVTEAILARQIESPLVTYKVVGKVDDDEGGENAPGEVRYDVKTRLYGALLTTDTNGDDEKANIILAELRWQGGDQDILGKDKDSKERLSNEGLEDLKPVDERQQLRGQRPAGNEFATQLDLRGLLKTNGGVMLKTVSLIRIQKVEFEIIERKAPVTPTVGAPEQPEPTPPVGDDGPEEDAGPAGLQPGGAIAPGELPPAEIPPQPDGPIESPGGGAPEGN